MPHIVHGYLDMSVHCALRTVSLPSSVLSLFSVLYTSSPAPPNSRSYELFKFTTRSFPLLPPLGLSLPYLTSQQAGKKKGDHNVCLSRQSANLQRTWFVNFLSTGKITFQHVQEFVEEVILVTDDEIKRSVH